VARGGQHGWRVRRGAYLPAPRSGYVAACLFVITVTWSVPALAQTTQAQTNAYFDFLAARRLESQGDADGALAALKRAASTDPKSAEVKAEIASFHLRHNQRPEAEDAAKTALAIDEKNVEANRVLGLIYTAVAENTSGRVPAPQAAAALKDAVQYLERAVSGAIVPDPNLQFTLGRLYLRGNDAQKAVQTLVRALSQNPGSVQARLTLAQAYGQTKDLPSAIAVLDEIVEDEPRVAAALGQYQEQAGQLADAAESYTIALAVQPTNRELKFRRAAALYNAKDYKRSAEFSAEARKQHPEDSRFPRLEARALFDAGDRAAGLAAIEAAGRAFPRDMTVQFAQVDLYADAGQAQAAEKVLRQILTVEPSNANALNYLGYLLAVRGDQLDEAISLVRRALQADPQNGAYLDSLGWAYFKRGDLEEAQKYLAEAAVRMPKNSEVLDHLGDVHARRGRLEDAIVAWTQALGGDGDDVDRAAIEKKVQDAKGKLGR
jgi:tetratricopeptide (TPR) repeat protein